MLQNVRRYLIQFHVIIIVGRNTTIFFWVNGQQGMRNVQGKVRELCVQWRKQDFREGGSLKHK